MRLPPILLRVLLLIACASCLHAPPYETPHKGWKLVSSEHFRVYTDESARVYEYVLEILEETHMALNAGGLLAGVQIPQTEVLLLGAPDFEDLLGGIGGLYAPDVGRSGMLVIRESEEMSFVRQITAHELAHRFIGARFPRLPRFLNEGLAGYLETAQVRDGHVFFGLHVDPELKQVFETGMVTPLAELGRVPREEYHGYRGRSHYATSWALIHYLLHGEQGRLRGQFGGLMDQYRDGRSAADPMGALAAVFPGVSSSQLDERLRGYAQFVLQAKGVVAITFPLARTELPAPQVEPADRGYVKGVCQELRQFRVARKL